MLTKIRVRIAPSPTGFLHIGSARTALFNYLFAKKYQGTFILRIEDTDKERSFPEFEKDILENLKWLGIEWNEEIYRQSERINIYTKYLKKLLNENKAYYCFCSKEELEAIKQDQVSRGLTPHYIGKCSQLSEKETKKNIDNGKASVIRFNASAKKIVFQDLIRNKVEFDASLIGDFVIAKDLITPLYNFVVVVDDFEMKITHIIRGEDHISNTPKQILIQQALGFYQPEYAHLPLILAPDRTKLSKRHNVVSIAEYRRAGYLPETLINFMALLGWNPGNEKEIYWLTSLIKEFSLERVQRGGAIFNIKKLDYLNGFYIRQKSIERLTELCLPCLIEAGLIIKQDEKFKIKETKEEISLETLKKIISIYQERLKKLSEIQGLTDFFFKDKLKYDKDLLRWREMSDKEVKKSLDKAKKILSKIKEESFNKENLEKILMREAERKTNPLTILYWINKTLQRDKSLNKVGSDRGILLWPLRVALTNKQTSASPFEIAEILGKEKTIKRIKEASKMF